MMSNRRQSLSLRIRVAFLLLGLTAIALTSALAFRVAEESLESATYERLTGIRETKRRQVETHLLQAVSLVGALGRDESVIDATLGFEAAWPPAGDEYQAVRRLHGEGLEGLTAAMGFEDLLLIRDGLVLYSVSGSDVVGSAIGELGAPTLHAAYRAIDQGGEARLTEYGPYADPAGVAAFAVAPIVDRDRRLGMVAARLSIAKLDEIMTGGGRWNSEGLGDSGETYLVGEDLLMRSDSRFLVSSPEEYFRQLLSLGVPSEQVERIRLRGTTVLTQSVDTPAVRRALAGESGLAQVSDYRGISVLSAYAPLEIPGLRWVLLSEIDTDEALAPVAELRTQTALLALAVSSVFLGIGYIFSKRTTEPLAALTRSVERFGRDDWRGVTELDAFRTADDEVARLALQFDEVSRRLRETTVSRDYLDDLLASMLNAVFTIESVDPRSSGPHNLRVRSANPAALRLLGYDDVGELDGASLDRLLADAASASGWLDALAQHGHTPTFETMLTTKDGRQVPVLFAAARLRSRGGGEQGAVCVAQDITDLRTAERRLQALNERLIHAQEEERRRLARELHDDVTQRLGALAIEIGSLARNADRKQPELENAKEHAIQLAHDVQGFSRRLHPSILDDLGLAAALRSEVAAARTRLGVPVSLAAEDPPPGFPKSSALALYRIAQECFQNIAKHARPTEVNVELDVWNGNVRLRIEDDGAGFDPSLPRRGGMGITSMEERARLAGGRLTVRSSPGQGAKFSVEMPVAPAPEVSAS
jgi:PAS domain S-box-containing protein